MSNEAISRIDLPLDRLIDSCLHIPSFFAPDTYM